MIEKKEWHPPAAYPPPEKNWCPSGRARPFDGGVAS